MKRLLVIILISAFAIAIASISIVSATNRDKATPTFAKDVAPILFKNCAACHRSGEIAPMSLLSYREVRPWAKSIREAVVGRTMPPWGADPSHGEFINNRALSQKDIDTIVAWVEGGAKEGDPKDLPKLPKLVEGWNIGKPDAVFSMPEEVTVPAEGVLPYRYFAVPTNFTEDKYVELAEIRPSNRSVVHHAVVFIVEPGRGPLPPAGEIRSDMAEFEASTERSRDFRSGNSSDGKFAGYTPGEDPLVLRPGVAKLIKKGSVLIFNVHYTPNGAPARDRTSMGLVFARRPVEKHVVTAIVGTRNIAIPPGDAAHEVKASFAFKQDSHIESLRPHMHARGKDFLYTLVYPDGTAKVLLWVPRYDFNWQMHYNLREAIAAPKGSRLECVAHYDNSAKNKYNPDPTQLVQFGPQTWDEMLAGYFDYTVDSENLFRETGKLRGAAAK